MFLAHWRKLQCTIVRNRNAKSISLLCRYFYRGDFRIDMCSGYRGVYVYYCSQKSRAIRNVSHAGSDGTPRSDLGVQRPKPQKDMYLSAKYDSQIIASIFQQGDIQTSKLVFLENILLNDRSSK